MLRVRWELRTRAVRLAATGALFVMCDLGLLLARWGDVWGATARCS